MRRKPFLRRILTTSFALQTGNRWLTEEKLQAASRFCSTKFRRVQTKATTLLSHFQLLHFRYLPQKHSLAIRGKRLTNVLLADQIQPTIAKSCCENSPRVVQTHLNPHKHRGFSHPKARSSAACAAATVIASDGQLKVAATRPTISPVQAAGTGTLTKSAPRCYQMNGSGGRKIGPHFP